MQGEEQKKRLLENSLFDEIKNCTYRDVEGFFPKCFDGSKWSKRSEEIYQPLKPAMLTADGSISRIHQMKEQPRNGCRAFKMSI
jgi:hypothetical protein